MEEFAVLDVFAVVSELAFIMREGTGRACGVVLALLLEFAGSFRPHLSL